MGFFTKTADFSSAHEEVQSILDKLASKSSILGAILVDETGYLIARSGYLEFDTVTLSTLVAASYDASTEVGRILGEENIEGIVFRGLNRHISLTKVGLGHILILVFKPFILFRRGKPVSKRLSAKISELLITKREMDRDSYFT